MRAYERFLNYIAINTQSDEASGSHPSFVGEFDLAKLLYNELTSLGLENITLDDKCYLYAKLPASKGYEDSVSIAFIAHMDTSPDASGLNVKAVLHENYDGSDVQYPFSGKIMKVSDFPELEGFKGETLITSDGTTLLGSDDKAGIAEIMASLEYIIDNNLPHGTVWVAFTPDEEIGEGADNFNLSDFPAKYAYTVDGGDVDTIEYENFNAASAVVEIRGFSVHPGYAKDKMINASNVAIEFHQMLPCDERPEHTCDREGFYHLTDISSSCEKANLNYIIRDHDRDKFEERKKVISKVAENINKKYGKDTVKLVLKDSYYNMYEKILPHMHLVENAKEAIKSAGLNPVDIPIRGGTDGARLSFEGLPCPNLGTGGYNFHGPFEFNSVERMDIMVNIITKLIDIYKDYKA